MESQRPQAKDITRTLPASHEAEQGCLCSILLSTAKSVEICESTIKPCYFHNPAHKTLYETIVGLHHVGTPTDIITLTGELQKARRLPEVGGAAYLAELMTILPTAANLPYYLELMVQGYHEREIIRSANRLIEVAYDEKEEILEASQQTIIAINAWRERVISGPDDPTDQKAWFQLMEELETRYDRAMKGQIEGVPTGMRWFDQISQGLLKRTLYLIGGLPSEGKSALLSQWAVAGSRIPRVRDGKGHKSLIFSMEMSGIKMRERTLSQDRAITSGALKAGLYSELELGKISSTAGHVREHVFIYAKRLSVSEIAMAIKRALAKHPDLDWVGIDYLQYVRPEGGNKNTNREREVAIISQGINDLKNEFDLPIVCCVALNADQEQGKGRKPRLGDVRECKSVGYDADTALYLDAEPNGPELTREVEFLILKNRDGGLDERKYQFSKKYLLFEEAR